MAAPTVAQRLPCLSLNFPIVLRVSRDFCRSCRALRKQKPGGNLKSTPVSQTSAWQTMVGLEIHAQVASQSKMFSGSQVQFSSPPNSLVSFFDAALPGTLPVLNKYCVEAGILTALALQGHVNRVSYFDRKHYFYADLPAGYQITQQRVPLATGGRIEFSLFDPTSRDEPIKKTVRLIQIQLEQDSGKSLHDDENHETLVDLNRSGVGLMELVTKPDMCNGTEAAAMVRELQLILQYIGTCDGRMDEGSLRVDANISVNRPGEPPGTRTEVKNINSARFVKIAIDHEIARHIEILENGGQVLNETRSFDFKSGKTVSMRVKEGFSDYRFMPEPNLPPLIVYDNDTLSRAPDRTGAINIDSLKGGLPELPEERRQRLMKTYGITLKQSLILMHEDGLVEYFERMAQGNVDRDAKKVANWIITVLLKEFNERAIFVKDSPVSPEKLGELIDLMEDGTISVSTGKKMMPLLFNVEESRSLTEIIEAKNWAQIRDERLLKDLCEKIFSSNVDVVRAYLQGNKKVLNRLIGLLQQETQGRADPVIVNRIIKTKLANMKT
ncbi:glutamyl-tRNA(Gln) amidotransferase subunit B, mitochondrial-like isoform X1 [Ptychodera flava]|uniref:glutamyl-tRNA(Gln) amidotransferase subunit B, mitochondrial-like isoform X1 n=1 Tax=Ptychodera flava TaxID=63121 RepID=UPI003969D9FE